MHNYDEPVYLISVVSKILSIHPQTLRQYEREGLVAPSRTDGRIRLYSQRDIDKIKMILRLTRELGVNLAGVDIILRLKEKIARMESQVEDLNIEVMQYKYKEDSQNNSLTHEKKSNNIYDITIFEEFDKDEEGIDDEDKNK